jgi:hypothetical protein
MADFEYVACPKCHEKFMAARNFFVRRLTVIVHGQCFRPRPPAKQQRINALVG